MEEAPGNLSYKGPRPGRAVVAKPGPGVLRAGSLMSSPANSVSRRGNSSSGMRAGARVGALLGWGMEVVEDFNDYSGVGEEGEHAQKGGAFWADEGVDVERTLELVGPGVVVALRRWRRCWRGGRRVRGIFGLRCFGLRCFGRRHRRRRSRRCRQQWSQTGSIGEDAVVSDEILVGGRHQCSQASQEGHGLEGQVGPRGVGFWPGPVRPNRGASTHAPDSPNPASAGH